MLEKKYERCFHGSIAHENGYVVCKECGEVLDKQIVDTNFLVRDESFGTQYKQAISIGDRMSTVGVLGTSFHSGETTKERFNRLMKHDFHARFRGHETKYRIFLILDEICRHLNLPDHIKEASALRYRYIVKRTRPINNITLLLFCMWDSIRYYKHRTSFCELERAFKLFGHRVSGKSVIRDGSLYSGILVMSGIQKSTPKTPKDYISRHVAELYNNKDVIEHRLKQKKDHGFSNVNHYLICLTKKCYDVLERLSKQVELFGYNPLIISASTIYFVDFMISRNSRKKRILTQKMISEMLNVPEYSIRDVFIKFFKKFIT